MLPTLADAASGVATRGGMGKAWERISQRMSAARGVSSVSQEPVRTQRPPIQCLDRRFPDRQTLIEELAAWADCRSKKHTRADWHFTTVVPACF
jgi:hypothetical protein